MGKGQPRMLAEGRYGESMLNDIGMSVDKSGAHHTQGRSNPMCAPQAARRLLDVYPLGSDVPQ